MKIVITVPGSVAGVPVVSAALLALEDLAGGATLCPAQGLWRDPNGHTIIEPVEQHHFCFVGPERWRALDSINHATRQVCRALIEVGEQAVLVEYFRPQGYNVVLYTAKDFS